MMPRPGVDFPIDVALIDSDRQAIANGITTVFHATTWSWEPGLRGADNARQLLEAIEALRPQLAADTRFHLRHETYNLDAEAEIIEWLVKADASTCSPSTTTWTSTVASLAKPQKRSRMVERTGLSNEAFDRLVRARCDARRRRAGIDRPAGAGRAHAADVRMLSHDDESPAHAARLSCARRRHRRISGQRGDRARRGRSRRLHRVRRAQCRARRQPHRLDQGVRHDRQGPLLGPGVRLLLSGAAAGRLPPCRRRRAAAGAGLAADLGGAGARRRLARSRHARRGTARRHHSGRSTQCRCGRESSPSSPRGSSCI